MKLRLLYFGIVRERLGRRDEERELAQGETVGGLLADLARSHDLFGLGAGVLRVAVNREYVGEDHVLGDGDEVAIIPPVAGGTEEAMFEITDRPIDLAALVAHVGTPDAGAIATFLGTTRATNRGRRVLRLEYEAYAEMAAAEFAKIGRDAAARWEITRVAIVHRTGTVPLGEASVAIAVSAPHRRESIEACHYCIDALKLVAPIWKKEHFEGGEVWIGSLADCDHGEQPSGEGLGSHGHRHGHAVPEEE